MVYLAKKREKELKHLGISSQKKEKELKHLGISSKKKEKELKHLGISSKKRERVETSWYILVYLAKKKRKS